MARRASLSQVFEHATGLAREAEQWYARKRPANKTWGRILRLAAIAFGAVGALLPILAEIVNTRDDVAIAPVGRRSPWPWARSWSRSTSSSGSLPVGCGT